MELVDEVAFPDDDDERRESASILGRRPWIEAEYALPGQRWTL